MDPRLKILREACLKAAHAATCCYPQHYDENKSPLDGHCSAVATVVQATMGGDIVTGLVEGVRHYWNRLPGGQEVDLTSCQFGGDGYTPLKKGRKVKKGDDDLVHPMFLVFTMRVMEELKTAPSSRG